MMKITGLSHLFKWENLHNWWLTKYFFAPLYIVIKYFRTPVFIGYGFSWRDASLWPHRRTYRKRLLKKRTKNNSDELHNYNNRSQLHKCLSIIIIKP